MKLPNEKTAVAAREAKCRLENLVTEAQKPQKAAVEAARKCKVQRTAYRNSERLRAMAARRSAAGVEGLATEASRLSIRRKSHPLTVDEKAEKVRVETERMFTMRKVHKLRLFDYSINVTVMRLDLRRLLIALL